MRFINGWEWIVLLIIVIILFGPDRIGKLGGELGRSLRGFREGLQGDDPQEEENDSSENKKE